MSLGKLDIGDKIGNLEIIEYVGETLILCKTFSGLKILCFRKYPTHQISGDIVLINKIKNFKEEGKEFFDVIDRDFDGAEREYVLEIDYNSKIGKRTDRRKNLVSGKYMEEEIIKIFFKKYSEEGMYECDTIGIGVREFFIPYNKLNKKEREKIKKLVGKNMVSMLYSLFNIKK